MLSAMNLIIRQRLTLIVSILAPFEMENVQNNKRGHKVSFILLSFQPHLLRQHYFLIVAAELRI